MAQADLNPSLNPSGAVSYVDVSPLSRGKRVCVYLSDLFLNFLLSLFVFSAIVFPIYGKTTGYFGYREENNAVSRQMIDILSENKLYEAKEGSDRYDFDTNLRYCGDLFLKDCLTDHNDHDYFGTFYLHYLSFDRKALVSLYQENDLHHFFDYQEETVSLKAQYRKEFAPLLDPSDKIAPFYEKDYQAFLSSFFASSMYARMIQDLLHSDKITSDSPLYNYRLLKKKQDQNTHFHQSSIVFSVYISYVISSLILFLLIPLLTKRGRTITMLMLHQERVSITSFAPLEKRQNLFFLIYLLLASFPLSLFVPMLYLPFTELFALPQLSILSLVSLLLPLVSFIILLSTSAKQTLMDLLSHSVMIDSASLGRIFAAKGYQL